MDPISNLNKEIFFYIVGSRSYPEHSNLIKKHSENLKANGDFSFPLKENIWLKYYDESNDGNPNESQRKKNFNLSKDQLINMPDASFSWPIRIERIAISGERCNIFLNRFSTINFLLHQVLENSQNRSFGMISKNSKIYFKFADSITETAPSNVSQYRAKLVKTVLKNVITQYSNNLFTGHTEEQLIKINVRSVIEPKQPQYEENSRSVDIVCGMVSDHQKHKALLSSDEYISLRSTDMRLMAMHKYGIRVQDDQAFYNLIDQLGKAAVTIDLLEVKHTSPVSMKRNGQGNCKGTSFILYNSARIETLLRTFENRVEAGLYPKLPSLSEIDVSLLKEEEEWKLIFNYVIIFPSLIKRTIDGIELGRCAPHLLIQFLNGLVSLFSIYYRRCRILVENRPHLISMIHARIYLVKCIREILNSTLELLNISPIHHM